LSKAFGVYGGAVLCSESLRRTIQGRSRLFNGNTPLPLPLASAALQAVGILSSAKALHARLLRNIEQVRCALTELGYPEIGACSPIVPLHPSHPRVVPQLKRQCLAKGIFPSFIKYPGGPAEGYFRFALSSEHTPAQIEALIKFFREAITDEKAPADWRSPKALAIRKSLPARRRAFGIRG